VSRLASCSVKSAHSVEHDCNCARRPWHANASAVVVQLCQLLGGRSSAAEFYLPSAVVVQVRRGKVGVRATGKIKCRHVLGEPTTVPVCNGIEEKHELTSCTCVDVTESVHRAHHGLSQSATLLQLVPDLRSGGTVTVLDRRLSGHLHRCWIFVQLLDRVLFVQRYFCFVPGT